MGKWARLRRFMCTLAKRMHFWYECLLESDTFDCLTLLIVVAALFLGVLLGIACLQSWVTKWIVNSGL